MPFYKWILETGQSSRQKELGYYPLNDGNIDFNAVANRQMVQTIRHLSQLAGIAHDIFGTIEKECLIVLQRTGKLKDKIENCRSIVDNLNAKTVPVPVSTLSGPEEPVTPFASSHVDAKSPIFSTFPRPPEVDRLRQLANGPSPPAFIPSTMIADGEQRTSSATHIYCQPLEQSLSSSNSIMTSTIKVPSTIVPIDISGQPFSRMASFRRSFIHVDFFIRRKKKKDKRRNTVTEGDTKELKDALHNIINEKSQYPSNHENNHNIQQVESSKTVNGEKNNNSSDKTTCSAPKPRNCFQLDTNSEEKNRINNSKNETEKLDLKNHYNSEITKLSSFSKRKTKGRIPISTVSAAMSVAVEMRQLHGNNKSEDQSSSGNWSYSSDPNSSDSENRRNSVEKNGKETASEISSHISTLSKENLQNRLKEIDANDTIPNTKVTKEMESSSYASSENNGITDDGTSNATSGDSEVFFISSDESDEETSDLTFEPNYGSSLSITTASNGSLNSLLSQTATEMASSTGTLTSIGLDRLPTPPPPPPTIITATANIQIITPVDKNILDKNPSIQTKKSLQIKHSSKKESKSVMQKNSKPLKAEKTDMLKNSAENSKNIFTSLVNMKTRTKDRNKLKSSEKINKTLIQPPLINMYGCDSPQNIKQLPLFIKENTSIIKNEPKNCMQSFSSNSTQLKPKILSEHELNFEKLEPKLETKLNPPIHNTIVNSTSACHPEGKDVEVPLKYVHRVTVTPIQRQSLNEQSNSLVTCRKTLFKDCEQRMIKDNDFNQTRNLNMFHNEQHSFEKPKPQRPMTLQPEKPKAAARVLLDPEGRVVQCTNSLDRKSHYVAPPEKYNYTTDMSHHVGHIRNQVITNESAFYNPICNQSRSFQSPSNGYQVNNDMINRRYSSPFAATIQTMHEPDIFNMVHNDCSISQENYKENFHPYHVQGNNSFYITDTRQKAYGAQSLSRQKFPLPRQPPIVITPDPNISGLPLNDTLLTQRNVKIHSKQMEKYNMPISITTSNSVESYTTSPKSLNSPISTEINKSPTTMSTEDLFAVIHNCKKRMNIKTDSDISLASSSRSSSPSYLRPISAKGALAETGFLSPRNARFDSRDRRSWADFRPSRETCGERKSLASDRLGPTKPTSMHDFKMLLLQTRSNSQILGPRKSAVEMLKVPVSCDRNIAINSMPLNFSPQNLSHSVPNSPSSEYYLCNGHSTVPFKRNNRARSSLQPRYTMYPPIFEDCLEDSENNRDIQQSAENYIDMYKNTHMQHNDNSLLENTSQNIRHWV